VDVAWFGDQNNGVSDVWIGYLDRVFLAPNTPGIKKTKNLKNRSVIARKTLTPDPLDRGGEE
jgi:hypothetical protein